MKAITVGVRIFDENNEYEVEEFIGNGSFGYVFKIKRISDNEIFAVKTIPEGFASQDVMKSFYNEINQALKVRGENLIEYIYVHDGSKFPDLPLYIIMEYANNGTLEALLKGRNNRNELFSNEQLKNIFLQLIGGMKIINEKLIHRDIKPDNILISNDIFKITDFGLAKVVHDKTRTSTFKGFGHVRYQAPECWKKDTNTIQMDIYSMGIVFYELATLTYPYDMDKVNSTKVYEVHLLQKPKLPNSLNAKLSIIFNNLIVKMMEKSTTNRFKTWEEVEEYLLKDSLPVTENSSMINYMLQIQSHKEDEEKYKRLEAEKKQNEIDEYYKINNYQIRESITEPMKEFIGEFNSKSEKLITIDEKFDSSTTVSYRLPNGNMLALNLVSLIDDNFIRTEEFNDWGERRSRKVLRRPVVNKRKVLVWGYIGTRLGIGFNLILLEKEDDMFGEWKILHNKNNWGGNRVEPFFFKFDEMEKEIGYIGVTHVYRTEVKDFSIIDIQNLLIQVHQE